MKQNNLGSMEKDSEMLRKNQKEDSSNDLEKLIKDIVADREKEDKQFEEKVTRIVDSRLEKFEEKLDNRLKNMGEELDNRLKNMGEELEKKSQSEELKGINSWLNKRPVIALLISIIVSLMGNQIVSYFQLIAALPENINKLVEQQVVAYLENDESINNEEEYNLVEEESSYDVVSTKTIVLAKEYLQELQKNEVSPNLITLDNPGWESNAVIGKEMSDGKEYTAEEVIGMPMLIPYGDGEYNILFYGQYNDQYFWDGVCTINVYEGDELYLITEATYDNGKMISYKQIIQDVSEGSGEKEWIIADRVHKGNSNSGISKIYSRSNDCTMQFDYDDVSIENLLTFDDYKEIIENSDETIKRCYCGDTSGGYYNDESGNAYLVRYTEDGYVDMLYQGRFTNGEFNDGSGDAWYIVKDGNGLYGYFKGVFEEGDRQETPTNEPKPVLYKDIGKYIDENSFDCDLTWYDNGME